MSEIQSKLARFIAEKIMKQPKRELNPDQKLISSGLIDSFSLVDVGLFVEDEFGVRIDDVDLTVELMDTLVLMEQAVVARRNA
ncbi:MAG: acyl carrier protein [Chloroflexi bacterium]|nr:acyl carrier protein [Chloroflexota bacterium]